MGTCREEASGLLLGSFPFKINYAGAIHGAGPLVVGQVEGFPVLAFSDQLLEPPPSLLRLPMALQKAPARVPPFLSQRF